MCYNRNKLNIIISIIISVFLLIAGYYYNNMSLFTGENLKLLSMMETLNLKCIFDNSEKDNVVYINTSYDKVVIDYFKTMDVPNAKPMKLGNTAITDRVKLIKLLELLKDVKYKYLILDLRFSKGLECDSCIIDSLTRKKTKVDDKLFSLINQLDRVVIPTHHDIKLINKELEKKSALADYNVTATETNFVRYEYFDSIPYIPLAVYNDLNKRMNRDTIACHYPMGFECLKPFAFYTQGYKPCYNSMFLNFQIRDNVNYVNESGDPIISELEYYNLSKHILNADNPESIVHNFEDKYIFIGNMTEDMHDTYAGPQPGCVILFKALKALDEQRHVVSLIEVVILLILYFLISLFIIEGRNIFDLIRNLDNPLLNFIIDSLSFALVLVLYNVIAYLLGGRAFSFIIPMLFFTILKTYILLKKQYKMKNNLLLIFASLLCGALMFMSFKSDDGKRMIKVSDFSSYDILVDGKKIEVGDMISMNSKLSLTHPYHIVEMLNTGDDIVVDNCFTCKGKCIWKKGDYRTIQKVPSHSNETLFWWITRHRTSSKGLYDEVNYLVGERRPFKIEEPIVNPIEQYYVLEVLEGKYKGIKIKAKYDDTDPVIWITRNLLSENGIFLDPQKEKVSLKFKVVYHNYGEESVIRKSLKIIFVK